MKEEDSVVGQDLKSIQGSKTKQLKCSKDHYTSKDKEKESEIRKIRFQGISRKGNHLSQA